jgi:hypothetical protein
MTEEAVFAAALEKSSPAERAAYLDEACSGDATLRQRVEALLQSHTGAGGFLETPAIQRAVENLEGQACPGATQAEQTGDPDGLSLDFLAPSRRPDSLGRLGHYEILESIGRGGMGVVFRAFDDKLHRVVAVKVMAPQVATNATARKRFVREAQAAAAIRNEHVIDIYAVEEANGLPYLAMEYIAGISLQERLDRSGPLALKETLRVGMQTAAGLAAAHGQGLIHRDVKPSNILLENGVERVKISDFGLARAADDASLSQSGVVAGTPQYMAPEQARGEAVDHRADLFSLGSVLYAMCIGRAPFRASKTMAVLKRVCEETPRPIREINPEIPDWLVGIVTKLHAKNAADRFQSAAEVGDLLGQHLAHLQQPSVAPMPRAPDEPAAPRAQTGARGRRWATAAVILLVIASGLGVTEATGVTNLRATVIRIFTPDGTLIVEVDDPSVKVTVEGDGGLVITGAGLEEIRLRPGDYRVHADRDGKPVPLEGELVSVAKGSREVVKMKMERAPAQAAAKAEKGAFMVMGGNGVAERKFDRLAEAVLGSCDGDTIEIRGNGPFLSQPMTIASSLTIRAAAGFRPVIKMSPEAAPQKGALLATTAALVLEGLEFHRASPDGPPGTGGDTTVEIFGAPLRAANCRFRAPVWANRSPVCMFCNCEFAGNWNFGGAPGPSARVSFENCILKNGWGAIGTTYDDRAALRDVLVQIERSTFVGLYSFGVTLHGPLPPVTQPIRLKVARCVFDCASVLNFDQSRAFLDKAGVLEPAEAEAMLLRLLLWQGERNLFTSGSDMVRWTAAWEPQPPRGPKRLEDWKRFWGAAEIDSLEGLLRFQGGNLQSRPEAALDQLTPDDFRLRADSAGYKAGKDGKDLGADVDLVGPGAAYERWKKTPQYQQWLRDTGQVKK